MNGEGIVSMDCEDGVTVYGCSNWWLRWVLARGKWSDWAQSEGPDWWPRDVWTAEEIDAAKARAAEWVWMLDDEPAKGGA